MHELELHGLTVQKEQDFVVEYKGKQLGLHRVDLIVENTVLIELKAVTGQLLDVHVAQTISERKVARLSVALLVNFGETSVRFVASKVVIEAKNFEKIPKSPNPGLFF